MNTSQICSLSMWCCIICNFVSNQKHQLGNVKNGSRSKDCRRQNSSLGHKRRCSEQCLVSCEPLQCIVGTLRPFQLIKFINKSLGLSPRFSEQYLVSCESLQYIVVPVIVNKSLGHKRRFSEQYLVSCQDHCNALLVHIDHYNDSYSMIQLKRNKVISYISALKPPPRLPNSSKWP